MVTGSVPTSRDASGTTRHKKALPSVQRQSADVEAEPLEATGLHTAECTPKKGETDQDDEGEGKHRSEAAFLPFSTPP